MATTFSSFDLNLLRVFDAIMEERSVLRASQKVFLSQSAVSHNLARLREQRLKPSPQPQEPELEQIYEASYFSLNND